MFEIVGIGMAVMFIGSLVMPGTRRLWKGFGGLFIGGIESANPQAMMEAARAEFRTKMANYNQALARIAGIAERLKMQVKVKNGKLADLETRILANHKAGNMDLAASLARERQELAADLEHDQHELNETDAAYQDNLRQAKITQKEFNDKIRAMESKLSQVQIKEAQAEAGAALSNASFNVADLGDTMKTVDEQLDKRFEKAAGKARLVHDLVDMDHVVTKENEQKALEQDALASFLASKGIGTATPAPQVVNNGEVVPPTKEMGAVAAS